MGRLESTLLKTVSGPVLCREPRDSVRKKVPGTKHTGTTRSIDLFHPPIRSSIYSTCCWAARKTKPMPNKARGPTTTQKSHATLVFTVCKIHQEVSSSGVDASAILPPKPNYAARQGAGRQQNGDTQKDKRPSARLLHHGMTSPLKPQNVPEFERSNPSILAVSPATDSDVSTKPELPVILVRTHPAHAHTRQMILVC